MIDLKILFIESSYIVRVGLRKIIEEKFESGVSFDTLSPNALAHFKLTTDHYDLVILGSISRITALLIEKIKRKNSKTQILIFAGKMEYSDAINCLLGGADGYVTQNAGSDEIFEAIKSVLAGRRFICLSMMEQMVNETLKESNGTSQKKSGNTESWTSSPFYTLSSRQFQIAERMLQGQSTSTIATSLDIAHSTLATHKTVIFKKLGVKTLVEFVNKYYDEFNSGIAEPS
ncbi:response regulator transcription factor [Dyadobacter sp. CY356]|uniref:LuxR C-terminal-related transcriptional regulator n=1 Tax=Dyadobacter sp. CY356 TaxID=2906442 RepID=UPI001F1803EF|nr:response regulator transcription factor [Dyadobacter sp. CY356]MCF0056113.1 response regulator transcription factor [Dyadobacter sp. CY356]